MSILLHGDCLEKMKGLDDDSIDLIFCDLPYGQTSCKWDCPIDLDKFWVEVVRIKKLKTQLLRNVIFGMILCGLSLKVADFYLRRKCL